MNSPVFDDFLNSAKDVEERTASGKLFQTDVAAAEKRLPTMLLSGICIHELTWRYGTVTDTYGEYQCRQQKETHNSQWRELLVASTVETSFITSTQPKLRPYVPLAVIHISMAP